MIRSFAPVRRDRRYLITIATSCVLVMMLSHASLSQVNKEVKNKQVLLPPPCSYDKESEMWHTKGHLSEAAVPDSYSLF